MKLPYQWTSAAIGMILAAGILFLVRRDRMQVRHALWWLTVAASTLVLGLFPRLVDKVGKILGIHYPPILLVVVSIGLLLIKLLTQDIDRSRQERKIRRLAQRLAILEGAAGADAERRGGPAGAPGPRSDISE
jgi:hypothetical protein